GSNGAPASLQAIREGLQDRPELGDLLRRAGCADLPQVLSRYLAEGDALRRFAASAPPITDDNLLPEYSAPRQIGKRGTGELLAQIEAVRQDPTLAFPEILRSGNEDLLEALRKVQRGRRDRMRLALALQREDFAALASPSLAAAASLLRQGEAEPAIPLLRRARDEAPESPVIPLML